MTGSASSSIPAAAFTLALLAAGAWVAGRLVTAPPPEVVIAAYATSLRGRTHAQKHNALLSARRLAGRVIPSGAVFSFNKAVRSWTADEGYLKAPVSYDGQMVRAYGGGVCQTSTTLYNAALLAGLPILERHRHVFVPHYVEPGRDAAVAQENIDLRFRNPFPWSLRLEADARGDRLEVRIRGAARPKESVVILTQPLMIMPPARRTRWTTGSGVGRAFVRNPGAIGARVLTSRIFYRDGRETRRERLSDDSYTPMDRVVQVALDEGLALP